MVLYSCILIGSEELNRVGVGQPCAGGHAGGTRGFGVCGFLWEILLVIAFPPHPSEWSGSEAEGPGPHL